MPRSGTSLVHKNMVAATKRFDKTALIERYTETQNDIGEIVRDWSTLHSDVDATIAIVGPAAAAGSRQGEIRRQDDTIVMEGFVILLDGDYRDVTEQDRITIDATVYDIQRVEPATTDRITRILCEIAT